MRGLCRIVMTAALLIGGPGVAKGYHLRPELTAEKFIANPFGKGRNRRSDNRTPVLHTGKQPAAAA